MVKTICCNSTLRDFTQVRLLNRARFATIALSSVHLDSTDFSRQLRGVVRTLEEQRQRGLNGRLFRKEESSP